MVFRRLACVVALAAVSGCGDAASEDIGVTIPEGAREKAVGSVSDSLNMEARADDVLGPSGVRCEAVAHVEGRPQGKQYDHECIATFQNGGVMHCLVPAGEDGRMKTDVRIEGAMFVLAQRMRGPRRWQTDRFP